MADGTLFQSLLLWIWLTGATSMRSSTSDHGSFNPCCCGFGSPARGIANAKRDRPQVSILVVVDLAHRRAPVADRERDEHQRFNPCCCGFGSPAASLAGIGQSTDECFNPCCCGFGSPAAMRMPCVDVIRSSFNPCCCGFGSPARTAWTRRPREARRVSILVVVDLAHRRGLPYVEVPARRDRVSILVVVDLAHRPHLRRNSLNSRGLRRHLVGFSTATPLLRFGENSPIKVTPSQF